MRAPLRVGAPEELRVSEFANMISSIALAIATLRIIRQCNRFGVARECESVVRFAVKTLALWAIAAFD